MTSSKDYKAIAAHLADSRAWCRSRVNCLPVIDHITRSLADYLSADNRHFDRERFYRASGYGTGEPREQTERDAARAIVRDAVANDGR